MRLITQMTAKTQRDPEFMSISATQQPSPGGALVLHQGDTLLFRLTLSAPTPGEAWLRTNLCAAGIGREERVAAVEKGISVQNHDWRDLPMTASDDGSFTMRIGLEEVGCFHAKAFFSPKGQTELIWPQGEDTVIKVDPADYCAANTVYTVFVRQFREQPVSPDADETIAKLDSANYTVIPPSGHFRDVIKQLPFIMDEMGFRIIQLLPIHPTPTTYARMGRFGSPFAALDFKGIDPALAEFDRHTTPLDQFCELVDAVHAHNGRIWLDLPLNHTGWASRMQVRRPDWFKRNDNQSFASPGAWGVTWEDLSELDYSKRDLWEYVAGVILYWCRLGVDGFRCDAGYMIPAAVWHYITAKVRREYPATLFMLEGLGGKWSVVEDLVRDKGLNWAYSELFQCYSREEIEHCIDYSHNFSQQSGTLIHFCETHDNNRLASVSREYARMRTALCALLSEEGAFGLSNGVEWFATEKIDVHGASDLNWGAEANQAETVGQLCSLISRHPCFGHGATIQIIPHNEPDLVAVLRRTEDEMCVIVIANLSQNNEIQTHLTLPNNISAGVELTPLFAETALLNWDNEQLSVKITSLSVACLQLGALTTEIPLTENANEPERIILQRAKLLSVAIHNSLQADHKCEQRQTLSPESVEQWSERILTSPISSLREIVASDQFPLLTPISLPRDLKREVPAPSSHLLLFHAPHPFRIDIVPETKRRLLINSSLPCSNGNEHILLLSPVTSEITTVEHCEYKFTLFDPEACSRRRGGLLNLPENIETPEDLLLTADINPDQHFILTNGIGGMSQIRAAWGEFRSKYDAFLAINSDLSVPVDRHVLLNRWRIWVVRRDYSTRLRPGHIEDVGLTGSDSVIWRFLVPTGLGESVPLSVKHTLVKNENRCTLCISRSDTHESDEIMPDSSAIRIILRPDIDSRSNHTETKAFLGPEEAWKRAVGKRERGFDFCPDNLPALRMESDKGTFVLEPEWKYMQPLPFEKQRGLGDSTDLFSPGYFEAEISSGSDITIEAALKADSRQKAPDTLSIQPDPKSLKTLLKKAISEFIVRRDTSYTIIAGYPWFLDWGRDTLIALRGITAAGFEEEARSILLEFARYEESGTLPNMIRGNDAANRDTSDAPLWFIVAADEICNKLEANPSDIIVGHRSLADIIVSICESYANGTPNGIRVDPLSELVFSPSHFTWMDTNFPAGTPREGYPIEIQALWHRALCIAAGVTDEQKYRDKAERVKESILKYFMRPDNSSADCLHCAPGISAEGAVADDHVRPNQLFLITLGVITDAPFAEGILHACQPLLVPGAIRSLADLPVNHRLSLRYNGHSLNNPEEPYFGEYKGDEDTSRKPAYHNGTAWTWPFPGYAEAIQCVYGDSARSSAIALLSSQVDMLRKGCIGQLPEITDGNSPHTQRGCGAQAWGVTELYRVLNSLSAFQD